MKTYRHSVYWSNPYTTPPNDWPKTLIAVETTENQPGQRLRQKLNAILDRLHSLGIWGYNLGWSYDDNKAPRPWSEEAKKRNRRKRLEKRLSKKYSIPTLLEQALQTEIQNKPSYYL
jgi:hypothetical protein